MFRIALVDSSTDVCHRVVIIDDCNKYHRTLCYRTENGRIEKKNSHLFSYEDQVNLLRILFCLIFKLYFCNYY